MKYKVKRFSSSEENRVQKMKAKLLLDDLGTATGIHPLYRKAKEKVTGQKTLYHYTPTKNVESILKNGFDPDYDTYGDRFKKATNGGNIDRGVYFGNQSKSIPRSTSINRYNTKKARIREGKEIPEGFGDPGTMMTLKIPISEYKKMKKKESDPIVDHGQHEFFYKTAPRYRKEYDSKGKLGKLGMRIKNKLLEKHGKKDVVLLQEKVDPKYITKIDKKWS